MRHYRRLRRLTQDALAEQSGVERRYLGKIETGDVLEPGAETVRKLARALDVPVRSLAEPLGWWADEPAGEPDWERLLMDDDRFAPDVKDALRTLIKRELERPETKESKKTA